MLSCVRKFFTFYCIANLVGIFIIVFGVLFIQKSPFNILSLIWFNLLMNPFSIIVFST